jgi:hypothetical protein
MRYAHLAIPVVLLGGLLTLSSPPAVAAPDAGAAVLNTQASAPADELFVRTQSRNKQRVAPNNRGGRVGPGPNRGGRSARGGGGGGGGGGGFGAAMMGLGIAAEIASGIAEAEEARQAQSQDDAIAQCARRYRSYDPQTQTYIGKGRRVYNCP